MDGGIVKNENVIIIWIVFLKDIHHIIDLLQNILIGKVPFVVCPRSEEYLSGLSSIRGVQLAIVSRDEIWDHQ